MLRKKIFDSVQVVSMLDSALDGLKQDLLNEYQLSRDISILPLDELKDKPTLFWCKPLKQNFTDTAGYATPSDLWRLFCAHVTRIDNYDESLKWEEKDGEQCLMNCNENWKKFSLEVVREIAVVIIETASRDGDLTPFTPLDTSLVVRKTRSQYLRAIQEAKVVHTSDTAKE
jgi:hypothetical protein